uniref:Uncharacterized protein n=1 Tax=Acrobeloides nanus TaxID=290746 RepID=A0A914CC78_9BILA
MSEQNRRTQQQLNKVLRYQAMIPFLICVLPLGFVLILCALRVRTAGKGLLLPIILAWIPVLNPLAAIVLVREYRTFFTNSTIFRRIKAIILRQDFNEMTINATLSKAPKLSPLKIQTAVGPTQMPLANIH